METVVRPWHLKIACFVLQKIRREFDERCSVLGVSVFLSKGKERYRVVLWIKRCINLGGGEGRGGEAGVSGVLAIWYLNHHCTT